MNQLKNGILNKTKKALPTAKVSNAFLVFKIIYSQIT